MVRRGEPESSTAAVPAEPITATAATKSATLLEMLLVT